MGLDVQIKDGKHGTGKGAGVTRLGQLVTSPLEYSTPIFKELSVTGTAVNFFVPVASMQVVITDIVVETNKDVSSTNGALVEIYCAESATSTTATADILTLQPTKNDSRVITGLNYIIDKGAWVNAVTDDATVFMTISGYYVEAE